MIQSITFTNQFGRSIRCKLGEPEKTGLAISKVTGLGPGMSSMNIHNIATADGGYYGSARYPSRNIVLTILLLDYDGDGNYIPIENTRLLSYEFFSPKTKLQIVVETDTRNLVIEGHIESNEPEIFSQKESISVSILCPDYYFKMVSDTGDTQDATIYGEGLFQFPFSNESTEQKLIQFGDIETTHEHNLYYDGDAENGCVIEIDFKGSEVTGMSIMNEPIGNSDKGPVGFDQESDAERAVYHWRDTDISAKYLAISLSTIATKLSGRYNGNIYGAGNKIIISSMVGKKSAFFYDSSNNAYNILNCFDHLDWLKLYPGYNKLKIQTDQTSIMRFSIKVTYSALYIGV